MTVDVFRTKDRHPPRGVSAVGNCATQYKTAAVLVCSPEAFEHGALYFDAEYGRYAAREPRQTTNAMKTMNRLATAHPKVFSNGF